MILLGDTLLALTDGALATARSVATGKPVILFDLALDWRAATRVALAPSDGAPAAALEAATGFFQALGKRVSVIDDVAGMVVARTVAMLINEAAEVLHQRIASAADIDLSMVKGVQYPIGPLAWADAITAAYAARLIDNLASVYAEARYRCNPLLRRHALGARLFHTVDRP